MPDPKSYGAPTGAQAPITAGRTEAKPLTGEQLSEAYKQYMRTVVSQAHQHFTDHIEKTGQTPVGHTSAASAMGMNPNKSVRRVDEAVEAAQ